MKFKINNRDWKIKKVKQEKMRELEKDNEERNKYKW